MGDIVRFPIPPPAPNDYWLHYPSWAPGGYWATCETCRRADCFRHGHWFIACTHHTSYNDYN